MANANITRFMHREITSFKHKCPRCGKLWGHKGCTWENEDLSVCYPCNGILSSFYKEGINWEYEDSFENWVIDARNREKKKEI